MYTQSRTWQQVERELICTLSLTLDYDRGMYKYEKKTPTCLAYRHIFCQGAWPNLPHLVQQGLQFFGIEYLLDEIQRIFLIIFNKKHIIITIFKQNDDKNVHRLEFKGYKQPKIGPTWRIGVKIDVFWKLYNIKSY